MQKCSNLFMRNNISIKIRWRGSTKKHSLLWSFWPWTPWIKLCFARWTVWGDYIIPLFKPLQVFRAFLPTTILTWLGECCFFLHLPSWTRHTYELGFAFVVCSWGFAMQPEHKSLFTRDWAGGSSVGSRSHSGLVRCYREGKDHWSLFPSKRQTDMFDFSLSWQLPQVHQLTCAYYKVNKEILLNNLQLCSRSQSWHRWDTLSYVN